MLSICEQCLVPANRQQIINEIHLALDFFCHLRTAKGKENLLNDCKEKVTFLFGHLTTLGGISRGHTRQGWIVRYSVTPERN